MSDIKEIKNARLAITISVKGFETISFISSDKEASVRFYTIIRKALKDFEGNLKTIVQGLENESEIETSGQ